MEKPSYILRAQQRFVRSDGQRRVRRDDVRPRYVKPPSSHSTFYPRATLPLSPSSISRTHIALRETRDVCSGVGNTTVAIVVVPSQSPEAPSDGWQR